MTDKVKIDAHELTEVRLSADGSARADEFAGRRGGGSFVVAAGGVFERRASVAPRHAEPGSVHRLDSWNMTVADNGQDLLLTLRTPEGLVISFTLKPWQVEGMATIAAYGKTQHPPPKNLH